MLGLTSLHFGGPLGQRTRALHASLGTPSSRNRSYLVVHAAKGRSSSNAGKQKAKKGAWTQNPTQKPKMQTLISDEIRMFDPVSPSKDALRVGETLLSMKLFHVV